MRSVRLSEKLEKELDRMSSQKNVSRSSIIKEALVEYIANHKKESTPYELGKEYFGTYKSSDNDRSVTYKTRIKEKLRNENQFD
jgi:metal-responsive CopG/Arc/MetJ family transcriptional regulator